MSETILKFLCYLGPGVMAGYLFLAGKHKPVPAVSFIAVSIIFAFLANVFAHTIFFLQLGEEFVIDSYLSEIDGYIKYAGVSLVGAFAAYGVCTLTDLLFGRRNPDEA